VTVEADAWLKGEIVHRQSKRELRFDVARSPSLDGAVRARLTGLAGQRLTKDGVLVIAARDHRSQERNRAEALERLLDLIRRAAVPPKPRRATKPSRAEKRRRLEGKKIRSNVKRTRGPVREE